MSRLSPAPLFLGSWLLGLWLGIGGGPEAWQWTSASLLAAVSVGRKSARLPAALALTLLAGASYAYSWREARNAVPITGKPVSFTATVVEPPDIRQDDVRLTVRPESPSQAFSSGTGNILVTAPQYPSWSYGDKLAITAHLEKPEPFDGFDYPLYLERFGTYATAPRPKRLDPAGSGGNSFLSSLYGLRNAMEGIIQKALPEPESSFLGGILLGSRRAIPERIQDAMRTTGTSHIVAISGANITILLGMLIAALPLRSLRLQLAATALMGSFMVLLTGASASVLRGAAVACLSRYVRLKSRKAWPAPFLLGSAALLLLGNPLMLRADAGFQLSFGAFAGIAYLGSPCLAALNRLPFIRAWPEALRASAAETIAATLGTAPISLIQFGSASPLGIIVNPLILWLLPPITVAGLLLIALGWIPLAMALIKLPLWLMLHAILSIILTFSKLAGHA